MRKALTIILSVLLVVPMFVSCNQDDIIDDLFEPTYSIKVAGTIEHGTVSADKTNAHEGDTVTLTATPAEGYEFSAFSVTDDKANAITVTDGSFTMPADNVTVGATFSKTAETINQEAAAAVTTKIGAIGTVSYTAESKAKIDEARSAYDALTDAQKALIPAETLAILTTAESSYSTQKAAAEEAAANQAAADAVIAKINAIGTVAYTTESKTKIDYARTAYDELTGAQKALIPAETLAVLTKAETDYNALKTSADEATANQAAADAVIAKINAIGTVAYTTESKAKIDEARTAYDALTEAQKALVPAETLALLTAAETKYAELKAAAEQQTAGSISYATTTVEKTTADGAFTNELNKTGDGTVTYASSDEAVATVNASTGEVTIVGAGTATITATVTDSASYTYATKTASYTLTVTVAVSSVIINNAPTEALFVNSTGTLTATVSPDNATDKTIVWSSSDPDYVSINAETGEYTIMGTKGYGSATITATATNGTEDTSDDVTATCTITGKVTYTSLKAGDVLHVGDTFYVGLVYFNTTPSMSFNNSNGVITLVENDATGTLCYKFKRGSNGTMPNVSTYKVKDNTDGIYIVSGGGTSQGDRFTLAVHTKEVSFTVKRVAKEGSGYADGSYTIAAGTTWQQFIDSGNAPACLSITNGEVWHDMNNGLTDCGGTLIANISDNKRVKPNDVIIDGATYACSDYLDYKDHD